MEHQGTEDYLSEILFCGVATVWNPDPEKPQSWQKNDKSCCVPQNTVQSCFQMTRLHQVMYCITYCSNAISIGDRPMPH